MRILHTADWHVGRTLRGRDRSDEHRAVLAEITTLAEEREVDLVLVAGDLFETAAPSPEAERIVYQALLSLARAGAEVILISGNHDHPQRLRAVKPILEHGCGVRVAAELRRPADGGVLDLRLDRGGAVSVALLPFLSQRGIVKAKDLMEKDAFEHAQDYAARVALIVGHLVGALDPKAVRLMMAHMSITGARAGGGERSVHSGLDYAVPSNVFGASLHYVALGHYHRCQEVPAACPVWYSGSPLQLDFGEEEQEKSVLLIEATPDTPAKVEVVPLRSGRRLRTVRGDLATLEAMAGELGEDYLRVDVAEAYRPGLAEEVRELLPNAVDVRIAESEVPEREENDELPFQRSPEDLFGEYLVERGADDGDLRALFRELLGAQVENEA